MATKNLTSTLAHTIAANRARAARMSARLSDLKNKTPDKIRALSRDKIRALISNIRRESGRDE